MSHYQTAKLYIHRGTQSLTVQIDCLFRNNSKRLTTETKTKAGIKNKKQQQPKHNAEEMLNQRRQVRSQTGAQQTQTNRKIKAKKTRKKQRSQAEQIQQRNMRQKIKVQNENNKINVETTSFNNIEANNTKRQQIRKAADQKKRNRQTIESTNNITI